MGVPPEIGTDNEKKNNNDDEDDADYLTQEEKMEFTAEINLSPKLQHRR